MVEGGVRFARGAEAAWTQGGGKLASTLNYALVRDCGLDEELFSWTIAASTHGGGNGGSGNGGGDGGGERGINSR